MYRPLTRSLSRSNQQIYGFNPTSSTGGAAQSAQRDHGILSDRNSAIDPTLQPNFQYPPRSRPSRDYRHHPQAHSDENHPPEFYYKTASHTDLLQAGNMVYGSMYDAINVLQARYNELRQSHEQLLAARGGEPPITCPPTPKKQEDCPQIKFYTQRLYGRYLKSKKKKKGVLKPADGDKDRGGTRLANDNENVAMQYVEDEAGVIVDGDTAKNIRDHARAILIEIEGNSHMRLPKKWKRVGVVERKFFQKEMYARFPYLKICHDHWKCHYLAGRALSSYTEAKKRRKNTKVIKTEPVSDISSDDSDDSSEDSSNEDADEGSANPVPPAATGSSKRKSAPTGTQRRSDMPPSKQARTVAPIPAASPTPSLAPTVAPIPPTSPTPSLAPEMSIAPSSSSPRAPRLPNGAQLPEQERTCTPSPSPLPLPSPPQVLPKSARAQPKRGRKKVDVKGKGKAVPGDSQSHVPPSMAEDTTSREAIDVDMAESALSATASGAADGAADTTERVAVANPFVSLFGPASGPSTRLESLKDVSKQPGGSAPAKGLTGARPAPEAPGAAEKAVVFAKGMKKPTSSLAPKNLYYIDYLTGNEPVTPAAFEERWKTLTKDEIKKWNEASKARKAELDPSK